MGSWPKNPNQSVVQPAVLQGCQQAWPETHKHRPRQLGWTACRRSRWPAPCCEKGLRRVAKSATRKQEAVKVISRLRSTFQLWVQRLRKLRLSCEDRGLLTHSRRCSQKDRSRSTKALPLPIETDGCLLLDYFSPTWERSPSISLAPTEKFEFECGRFLCLIMSWCRSANHDSTKLTDLMCCGNVPQLHSRT